MLHKIVIDVRLVNNSGIGRYIKELLRTIKNEQYEICLLVKKEDIQLVELAGFKLIPFKYPIYSITEQIAFIFKVPRCKLFISPHYNIPVFLPQAKKMLTIIPDVNHLVFSKEFSYAKRLYAKILFSIVVKKSNLIITISEFSKSEIIRYTKCEPNNIVVAKLSIDKAYFGNIDINSNSVYFDSFEPFFLYVGNVKPHKNLRRSILAFNEFLQSEPNYKFIIVGKVENLINADIELFNIIKKNEKLRESIIFTGPIPDNELVSLYKRAKALVFVSLYEGFGIPPLEAMFFECPVVASREASLPEICGDAVLYVDAYDVKNIAYGMHQISTDISLRKQLLRRGKLKVDEYDWGIFSAIVKKSIKSLMH